MNSPRRRNPKKGTKRKGAPRRRPRKQQVPVFVALEEITVVAWKLFYDAKNEGFLIRNKAKGLERRALDWMVNKGILSRGLKKMGKKTVNAYLPSPNGLSVLKSTVQEIDRLKREAMTNSEAATPGSTNSPPKLADIKARQIEENIKKHKEQYRLVFQACAEKLSSKKHQDWFSDPENISNSLAILEGYTDHYEASGTIRPEVAASARTIIKALRAIQSASRRCHRRI